MKVQSTMKMKEYEVLKISKTDFSILALDLTTI